MKSIIQGLTLLICTASIECINLFSSSNHDVNDVINYGAQVQVQDSRSSLRSKRFQSNTLVEVENDRTLAEQFSIRISTGSLENWVDADGITWEADKYFGNNGDIFSLCPMEIANTTLDSLYCKERYFNKWVHTQPYTYDIPVPRNGAYTVKLHFAELTQQAVGNRIFDVWIGGSLALKNFDIYKEVGFATAMIVPMITQTSNGKIKIDFVSKVENPKICAIEVIEIPDYVAPPTSAPIMPAFTTRISAGAAENWVDDFGITWESDKYYNNKGAVHWVCPAQINGTELDSLYCKDRYFNKWAFNAPFTYDIPVPRDGTYSVKLHFAETSHTTIGARIFDVLVGEKMVFKNLDIVKQVGPLAALIIPVVTTSINGTVSIELIPNIENPKICAIEVIELVNYIPPPTAAPTMPAFTTRISAGASESWVDNNGITWEMDKYFDNKGEVFWQCPLSINGTDNDSLYCKERYFNKWKFNAPYEYVIPVPRSGSYNVKLHFAETSLNVQGGRIFDVKVGGKVVMGSLDIFAEAGFRTAYILPVITTTRTGFVNIELIPKIEHPKICAIEVIELPDYVPPPTAAPVVSGYELRINSGGVNDYVDRSGGSTWIADNYFIGGGVLFKRHYDILWTPDDEVYHIERHGSFRYEIPVPDGTYNVSMHFTELHFNGANLRKFDVLVEDQYNLKNLDIFAATAGIRRAWVIQLDVVVTDGLLSMDFIDSTPKIDMPKISGLEVKLLSTSTAKVNPFPLRINCGGKTYTEKNSTKVWLADKHFIQHQALTYNNGATANKTIANEIYHTGRTAASFRYEIPVPSGSYDVTLHFAETALTGVGKRIFDFKIEGAAVPNSTSVDIVKLGGGVNFKPVTIKARVSVTDGLMTILFTSKNPAVSQPMISAIEITTVQLPPVPTKAPTRSPTRAPINAPNRPPVPVAPKTCTIPKITPNSWATPFSKYPINVAEPSGGMIGNDFVIFGGFKNGYINATTETYALDMTNPTATWRPMDNMPFPKGLTHQGLVVIGMKAYLCGGYVGGSLGVHDASCFVYDHSKLPGSNQQWSNFTALPMGGRSGGGMIYDSTLNAILYTGGSQRTIAGQPGAIDYKDSWMYSFDNPVAGWVKQSNIPFYGNHMNSVTVVDGMGKERHYIFGGQTGDYELWGNTAVMYEYIPRTDTYIKRMSMPFGRGHSTFAVRPVGCGFLVAGGRTNKGLTGDISYYSVESDTWQSIGTLPVDIHTNICVIVANKLRCETGWATGMFSAETTITL